MRALLLLGLVSCGSPPSNTLVFRAPQGLVACAQPPSDLQARLWVSGTAAPCFLAVDVGAGTAAGACEAVPGIERRFTLDWFVDVGGREVMLAQGQKDVDLAGQQESLTLTFVDSDISSAACKDMSVDSFNGSDVVDVDGSARPVCDLDDDGADNLSEVCVGGDPLGVL